VRIFGCYHHYNTIDTITSKFRFLQMTSCIVPSARTAYLQNILFGISQDMRKTINLFVTLYMTLNQYKPRVMGYQAVAVVYMVLSSMKCYDTLSSSIIDT
jgi:hypothetical protein